MGSFSALHWLVVLLVVVCVFGTKKLRNTGADLGAAVKGFRDGIKSEFADHQPKGQLPSTVSATTGAEVPK